MALVDIPTYDYYSSATFDLKIQYGSTTINADIASASFDFSFGDINKPFIISENHTGTIIMEYILPLDAEIEISLIDTNDSTNETSLGTFTVTNITKDENARYTYSLVSYGDTKQYLVNCPSGVYISGDEPRDLPTIISDMCTTLGISKPYMPEGKTILTFEVDPQYVDFTKYTVLDLINTFYTIFAITRRSSTDAGFASDEKIDFPLEKIMAGSYSSDMPSSVAGMDYFRINFNYTYFTVETVEATESTESYNKLEYHVDSGSVYYKSNGDYVTSVQSTWKEPSGIGFTVDIDLVLDTGTNYSETMLNGIASTIRRYYNPLDSWNLEGVGVIAFLKKYELRYYVSKNFSSPFIPDIFVGAQNKTLNIYDVSDIENINDYIKNEGDQNECYEIDDTSEIYSSIKRPYTVKFCNLSLTYDGGASMTISSGNSFNSSFTNSVSSSSSGYSVSVAGSANSSDSVASVVASLQNDLKSLSSNAITADNFIEKLSDVDVLKLKSKLFTKIQNETITDSIITNSKIADSAVTDSKIEDSTITGSKIADSTITGGKIAEATIENSNIKDGTITGAKINGSSFDDGQISGTAIDTSTFKDGQISGSVIDTSKFTDGQISGSKITNSSIEGSKIAESTITGTNIKFSSFDNGSISGAAIDTSKFTKGSIDGSTITDSTLNGNTIISGTINGKAITNSSILAKALSEDMVETVLGVKVYYQAEEPTGGTYNEGDIWYKTIADKDYDPATDTLYTYDGTNWVEDSFSTSSIFMANSITANEIITDNLSAISSNLGNITGGSINIKNKFIVDGDTGNLTANITGGSLNIVTSDKDLDIITLKYTDDYGTYVSALSSYGIENQSTRILSSASLCDGMLNIHKLSKDGSSYTLMTDMVIDGIGIRAKISSESTYPLEIGLDTTTNRSYAYIDDIYENETALSSKYLGISANAVSATKISEADTRNTNEPPSTWMDSGIGIYNSFKLGTTVGLSSSYQYYSLTTFVPWKDNSGGRPVQLAVREGDEYYLRGASSDSAWNSWRTIITSANIGSQSVANSTYASNFGSSSSYVSYDLSTANTADTWVPVMNSGKLQHRVIPLDYNNSPSSLSVGHASSADTASSATKLSTYTITGAGGSARWYCFGTVSNTFDSSNFWIDVYSGNGYNALYSQNCNFRILIKDGWQSTTSASSAFGVTVYGYEGFGSSIQVKVMATSYNSYVVYAYLPWSYWNGTFTIGGYGSFTFAGTNSSSAPTSGTEQTSIAYYTSITSGNISSQSVNYATSAGEAKTAITAEYATRDSNANLLSVFTSNEHTASATGMTAKYSYSQYGSVVNLAITCTLSTTVSSAGNSPTVTLTSIPTPATGAMAASYYGVLALHGTLQTSKQFFFRLCGNASMGSGATCILFVTYITSD